MPEHRMLAIKERLFSGLRENEKYFFKKAQPMRNLKPPKIQRAKNIPYTHKIYWMIIMNTKLF